MVSLTIKPGEGMSQEAPQSFEATGTPAFKDVVLDMFPTNPVAAMANGEMLQIIVFALLFGYAVAKSGAPGARIKAFFEDLNDVIMRLVVALIFAPYGVFCLMTTIFTALGWSEIGALAAYFFTVAGVLVLQLVVVYPLMFTALTRLSP